MNISKPVMVKIYHEVISSGELQPALLHKETQMKRNMVLNKEGR